MHSNITTDIGTDDLGSRCRFCWAYAWQLFVCCMSHPKLTTAAVSGYQPLP